MIPALFAEDDDEPEVVEAGQEEELFAVHFRVGLSGRDYFVNECRTDAVYPIFWGYEGSGFEVLRLPKGKALELLQLVKQRYMTPGGAQYGDSYHDLRLVGERSGDVRDPELLD